MAQKVLIKHTASGLVREGYYGYSWTYLFFGFFVPLFRGEITIAVMHAVICFFTFGLWQLIASFIYNKQYMTRMLTNGWVLADSPEVNKAAAASLGVVLPA